ncbi:MAG: efflux RND transporter periplasmic adaptor subunit, partial [Steroidobacteraceae bacterium]
SQSVLAKSERERATKLLQAHAISQEEYDTRAAGLEQAAANAEAAQAALDTAALNLTFTRVTAPISGRISRALVTAGNLVSSGQTLLTTLVSLDPIYVRFDGDEQAYLKYTKLARDRAHADSVGAADPDGNASAGAGAANSAHARKSHDAGSSANTGDSQAAGEQAGAQVMVGLADEPGYPHQGVMVFVDNELDPTTGTIRGRARLDNHDRVFTPGLFARVKLMGSNQYDALLINDSAVGTDQTVRYVLVVGADNKVQYRPVRLGPIIDGLRVVTDGLSAGETIVVNGLQRVRPGAAVTPERVAMGERHGGRGQPETLLARSAKLAMSSNTDSTSTSAGTSANPMPRFANEPQRAKLALNSDAGARPNLDGGPSNSGVSR